VEAGLAMSCPGPMVNSMGSDMHQKQTHCGYLLVRQHNVHSFWGCPKLVTVGRDTLRGWWNWKLASCSASHIR